MIDVGNINFRRASSTDFKGDLKDVPKIQIEKYLSNYSKVDLDRIQNIFDYFDIRIYRAGNAYPAIHHEMGISQSKIFV